MDGFLKWHTGTETLEQKKYKQLVGRLEAGRHKLTPIVDDIILSAVEGIQKGDNKFLNDYVLTVEQYQDVIWASQILKEIEYQYKTESKIRKWPNTDVIVNNVSVDYKNRMTSARGKSIVIDETDIVQLLELYEQMGEVIQKIIEEANQQNENARDKSRHHVRSAMNIKPSEKSVKGSRNSESLERADDFPPQIKSTLSVILKSSSGELNKKHSRPTTDSDSDKCEEGTNVFVKIQCISDPSEVERDEQSVLPTDCDRQSTPHYHIRLGGEPVTLKVNQNNVEEGAVYCINTGTNKEDNDIKIVIKQCPECFSTVIGSTSKIRGMLGESHESITLHGKGPRDPNDMAYSSDETDSFKGDKRPEGSKLAFGRSNSTCPCHKPSSCRCHESERIRINIIGGPCPCDDNICLQNKTQSSSSNSTKMDVLIDAENVDKSTVKFNGKASKEEDSSQQPTSLNFIKAKSSLDAIHGKKESSVIKPTKKKSLIPLMRKRICSSMEFDVTTVHTRLRDQEIEHTNSHIVVELKKMGVDHLLRACRPAKCCRKAILNERQRTALPYCVSLKSLPLLGNDIQVIEQSYDMSVKKIKNSLDLTQNHKDALAYYVSLGRDDFRPNINFPWVIPVYDVRLDEVKNRSAHNDRFFILKKSIAPDESKSMSSALSLFNEQQKQQKCMKKMAQKRIRNKRYFALKKQKKYLVQSESSAVPKRRNPKMNQRQKVKFKKPKKTSVDKNYLEKMMEWDKSRGIYKRKVLMKNIWSNVDQTDQVFFDRHTKNEMCCKNSESCQLDLKDILFNFNDERSDLICNMSKSDFSLHRKSFSHFFNFGFSSFEKKSIARCELYSGGPSVKNSEGGDCSALPPGKMLDVCLEKLDSQIAPIKSFSDTQLSNKTRRHTNASPFWNHVSEEYLYTTSAIRILVKRSLGLGKIRISEHDPKWKSFEDRTSKCVFPIQADCEVEKGKINVKKNLEYYIGLIDGDLVWGQSLPLVPQNYKAYYNYSNVESIKSKDHSPNGSRASTFPSQPPQTSPRTSSISEIPLEDLLYLNNRSGQNTASSSPTSGDSEDPYVPWGPFLVSESSLPTLQEVAQKKEVGQLEAPKEVTQRKKDTTKDEPTTCASKPKCVDNLCKTCKSKACETIKKKSCGQGIVIDITKTKSNGNNIIVEAEGHCNKEICELYKNKALVPDNANSSKEKDPCDKRLMFTAKDNIQIVIKNKKISVSKKKGNKKSKETKNKEK